MGQFRHSRGKTQRTATSSEKLLDEKLKWQEAMHSLCHSNRACASSCSYGTNHSLYLFWVTWLVGMWRMVRRMKQLVTSISPVTECEIHINTSSPLSLTYSAIWQAFTFYLIGQYSWLSNAIFPILFLSLLRVSIKFIYIKYVSAAKIHRYNSSQILGTEHEPLIFLNQICI